MFPYQRAKPTGRGFRQYLHLFRGLYLAPARRALVHETLNMAKEGRKAWTYEGTRRVRQAPNIAYDNPMTNGDGMGTSDQYDGYNGAP